MTNPKGSDESRRCKAWPAEPVAAGVQIMVPEGADYEVRRELLRAGRRGGLDRLDNLARKADFLPVTQAIWYRAAENERPIMEVMFAFRKVAEGRAYSARIGFTRVA